MKHSRFFTTPHARTSFMQNLANSAHAQKIFWIFACAGMAAAIALALGMLISKPVAGWAAIVVVTLTTAVMLANYRRLWTFTSPCLTYQVSAPAPQPMAWHHANIV